VYEKFYGLKTSPFRLSPDPAFFFGSKGHKRALAYLRYGVNQKEGFIVITGTPGTGKTTLARALLAEMSKNKTVVSELNTTHLQADDVLRMVAASYGLAHENESKATLLKRLEEFFLSRFRAGYHVLLIVDESQNLPKESLEELRMLSNFYSGKDALLQIFLLGQEQFREQLYSPEMEQLRQRVVASCHLDPLDQEESSEYIQHRLRLAGWQGDPKISERAFARIYSVTKGVPRRINTFCDRLMLFGALENVHVFKDDEIKAVAKELSIETTSKNDDLAKLNPADSEESVDLNGLDTEQLKEFSDEVTEVVPINGEQDPLTMSQIEIEQDDASTTAPTNNETTHLPGGLKAVSNGEKIQQETELDATPTPKQGDNKVDSPLDTKPDWWELVALAVNFVAQPQSHKGITSSKRPLPKGITEFFEVGLGKKKIPSHMRSGVLEDISDEEIQSAVRFYIKKVLLSSTADYYRRLGVERNASQEHIRTHYKYLFRIFQPDKEENPDEWDETYTRRINQAYGALRSEQKRQEYDDFLKSLDTKKGKSSNESVSVNIDKPEELTMPLDSEREEKKTGSPLVTTLIGVIILALLGGGYIVYEKQKVGDINITDFVNNLSGKSDSSRVAENNTLNELPIHQEEVLKEDLLAVEEIDVFDSNLTEEKETVVVLEKPIIEKTQIEIPEPIKPEPVIEKAVEIEKQIVPPKPIEKPKPILVKPVEEVKKVEKVEIIKEQEVIVKKEEPKPVAKVKTAKIEKIKEEAPKIVAVKPKKEIEKPKPLAKAPALDEPQLNNFVSAFTLSYEEGKIDPFIELFATNAATNDGVGRDLIRQDYEALFDSTEMRVIDLQGLKWDINGENASANGDFVVTVLRKGGDSMRKFEGNIKLDVIKISDKLKIKGMYHSYGEEDN